MAKETQYTANTAMITISSGSSYLDGTDSEKIISGAAYGTYIKTVTIKAQGSTTNGMIRLYVNNGTYTKLIYEVKVPTITRSSRDPSFEATIDLNYQLDSGYELKVTTENSETFNIIAEGLDWTYYTTSIRPESTNYTANNGLATTTDGNSLLDGDGAMVQVLQAASNGTVIQSIVIKAITSTTPGMIRLFLNDGTYTKLLTEIPVPYVTKSATAHSFSHRIDFNGRDFALKSGWYLYASTENGDEDSEYFNIIAEGLDWTYPA